MYTPTFYVKQDDNNVFVYVKALYARPSEVDVFFGGKEFLFFCPPYFLRLFLPKELDTYEGECVSYEPEDNLFIIKATKRNAGEYFPDLDMLTKLLTPDEGFFPLPKSRDNNMPACREPAVAEDAGPAPSDNCYGFANAHSHMFLKLDNEISHLLDVSDPDACSWRQRKKMLHEKEQQDFCESTYLADLHNDMADELLGMRRPWSSRIGGGNPTFSGGAYTAEQIHRLQNLPKKNVLLDPSEEQTTLYSLMDIVFAFLYDCRVNGGDECVESAWNVRKLSATLSGLVRFENLRETVISGVRRSVCYPLVRRFDFSMKVLKDLADVFSSGKVTVLKCLLSVHEIFAKAGDYMYLLNVLYITDYCVWLQTVEETVITGIGAEVSSMLISREEIGFQLDIVELVAKLTIEEYGGKQPDKQEKQADICSVLNATPDDEDYIDSDDVESNQSDDNLEEIMNSLAI